MSPAFAEDFAPCARRYYLKQRRFERGDVALLKSVVRDVVTSLDGTTGGAKRFIQFFTYFR